MKLIKNYKIQKRSNIYLSEIPSSNWNSTKGRISKDTKLWTKGCPQLLHLLPPRALYKGLVVEHLKLMKNTVLKRGCVTLKHKFRYL